MRIAVIVATICAFALCGPAVAQSAGDFAAAAANNEGNLQVRWGKTAQEAKAKAAEACAKVSKTCASDPASTNILDDYFAWICCYRPHFSCASPSHETRDKATEEAMNMMSGRGYSDCSVRSFFSARTGKQQ
jgi:hypothetical protein